jgi:hypothetical protein
MSDHDEHECLFSQVINLPQRGTHQAERVGIFCDGAEAKVDRALRRFLAFFARFSALKNTVPF